MHPIDHSNNIIELNDVSFSYGEHEILKDINLRIHRGDYLGIVGDNGSGKTTLLKIILGLLAPTNGSVMLFGEDATKFKERSKIGYVPQKAAYVDVNFPATVGEIVRMGRFARRGILHSMKEEDYEKSRHALTHVEMSAFEDRLIGELSLGQQQRVFIARALAAEPEIIFLDEPTTGVDSATKKEFYELLQKLNKDFRLTIVLITHDIQGVSNEAMHVACVDHTLYFHDSVTAYLVSEKHHQHG